MAEQNQPSSSPQGSGLAPNVASLLCYICGIVTGIIFLLIEKDNKDVKFHAWQSIFMGVTGIALWVVIVIFSLVPYIGFLFVIVGWLALLGLGILAIVAMIKAYQGERWKIPFIGDMAEKQAAK